jgi:hypothetical protein
MLRSYFLSFISVFIFVYASGQNSGSLKNVTPRIFLDKNLEYLEIINDTTLLSSINRYNDTANFKLINDTLFIHQSFIQVGGGQDTKNVVKIHKYRVIYQSLDTLQVINNGGYSHKSGTSGDTITFINIEKLKERVEGFKYLKLTFVSPWVGVRKIYIDNSRRVIFSSKLSPFRSNVPINTIETKSKVVKGWLNINEFNAFKDLLSKAMISQLNLVRDCVSMDGASTDFEILIDKKLYKSSGCDLKWNQEFLVKFLCGIDKNKGFLIQK